MSEIVNIALVMKMPQNSNRPQKYKSRNADSNQKELYKKFPQNHFFSNETNLDHFLLWNTFFRRNLHRFAIDYLGIKLYPYQALTLYLAGISNFLVIVASRASAKSFMIALYAVCRAILYPNSLIVLASATKGQAKLLVSEKIKKELMGMSPILNREITSIKDNQGETIVNFASGSSIEVVVANDNARGHRSNVCVREEFRQIKKTIDGSVLSPFQIVRQPPYMHEACYANNPELIEESVDIYISSSWFDNGTNWMWDIVDKAYKEMLEGKKSYLLAFDESVALKHKIKTKTYFESEKKKQDPTTWALEFLNTRLKENQFAFFSYELFHKNQNCKHPFYPRTITDIKSKRKNPYDIPRQKGEIRIVACDMAFIENEKQNDDSVFTCMRLLPESKTYKSGTDSEMIVDNGYRRIVPYIEPRQGGEIRLQAIRIRQLFEDFQADYIVLDTRNAGISVYDFLARPLYDEERNIEYPPLTCMNDDGLTNRIKTDGAEPRIYAINASQKLNSDIALGFRRVLAEGKIDFLISLKEALETILPNIPEYTNAQYGEEQAFYEVPFLGTQALFSEATALMSEKRADTGVIIVKEVGNNKKDFYTSCSYGNYFCSILERDMLSTQGDYGCKVFIN